MAQGSSALESLPGADRDRRQAAFRKLISDVSEHLRPEEVQKCSFLRRLPADRALSALDTLSYLLQAGEFSHANVEPLASLLKDVKRHDLVTSHVEPYRDEYPDAVQETEAVDTFSTQNSFTMHHPTSVPVSSPQRLDMTVEIPTERFQTASTGFNVVSQGVDEVPHTEAISAPQMHSNSTQLHIPVAAQDAPHSENLPPCISNSSSFAEFERYNPPYNENLPQSDGPSVSQQQEKAVDSSEDPGVVRTRHRSQQNTPNPHIESPVLPRANSYPRGVRLSTHKMSQQTSGSAQSTTVITPPSTLAHHAQTMSINKSATHRSVTPPTMLGNRTSLPVISNQRGSCGYEHNSLPHGISLRSSSLVSGSEASRPSSCDLLEDDQQQRVEYSPSGVFPPTPQQPCASSQVEGSENGLHFAGTDAADHGTLFRKRTGSRKRFLSKFRRFRHRSASKSSIYWSVKRDKLNEAIYKPRKEKLFKCPYGLELENGGKHAPRLTLYLHPYGYEEDAGKYLTLAVELDASVKSNIPSLAKIRVEITANESSEGTKLNEITLERSADFRILRCKAFLSHDQLKLLECENIDLQASARLLHT